MGKGRKLRGLRASFRKSLTGDGEKVTKKELPIIRYKILSNSLSDDWEEARREWEFVSLIEEEDYDSLDRFSDNCELCNQGGLRRNYEIYNAGTGKRFLVGSTCIKNFIILKGTETQEQSAAAFEFQVKQLSAAKRIQALIPSVLSQPTQHEALIFRNASKEILETLDNLLMSVSWG
ncbi:MAG: hypothetical protein A4E56_00185 [Pelotomaculum sp. PtaU1.Bin065]|nr:MAG: hypothetical protein A4E56_00185 [Pelotomaculum sp. PtaU1.Bin065]